VRPETDTLEAALELSDLGLTSRMKTPVLQPPAARTATIKEVLHQFRMIMIFLDPAITGS
jgi:hypothetical protein